MTKGAGTGISDSVAKIGDFGLAKKAEKNNKRKHVPCLVRFALYMAPESVVDHVQEAPSDTWALGCMVCEMLTGKPVWDFEPQTTIEELLRKIAEEYPHIPPEISKAGCLSRKEANVQIDCWFHIRGGGFFFLYIVLVLLGLPPLLEVFLLWNL